MNNENGEKTNENPKKRMILLDVETRLAHLDGKTFTLEELSKKRFDHNVVRFKAVGGNRIIVANKNSHPLNSTNSINVSSLFEIKRISKQVVKTTGFKIPEKIVWRVVSGIYPPLGIVYKGRILKVIDNKYGR